MMYVVAVLGVLAVVSLVVLFRRRDTQTVSRQVSGSSEPKNVKLKSELVGKKFESSVEAERQAALNPPRDRAPVEYIPPDAETLGVNRRQFLNRGIFATFGFGLSLLGVNVIKTLYPGNSAGFGSKIPVGTIADIKKNIVAGGGFYYFPLGRMWITEYPESAVAKAGSAYGFYSQVEQGLSSGVVALFQTCPHLGCRVPECQSSQWFECPCHGSQYNRVGEKKGGPAPRGMDRFPMTVSPDGVLTVDTGTIIQGPPIGVNTTGQEAEGPNCLSAGGGAH